MHKEINRVKTVFFDLEDSISLPQKKTSIANVLEIKVEIHIKNQ